MKKILPYLFFGSMISFLLSWPLAWHFDYEITFLNVISFVSGTIYGIIFFGYGSYCEEKESNGFHQMLD